MKVGMKLLLLLGAGLSFLVFINPENRSWFNLVTVPISILISLLVPYLLGYYDGRRNNT